MKSKNKNIITLIIGGLVALVLALYVFSEVLDSIMPIIYSCVGNGTFVNYTTCCVANTTCAGINYSATDGGYFGTAVNFINSILPVIGIIAGFLLIRVGLKKMK